MSDIFERLAAPFDPSEIDWRVGSTNADKTKGMALAYIDARAVMDRLDAVVGPGGWQDSYLVGEGKTICNLAIKCGNEWVWKADGAGNTDFEAEKGALSDAFKRAAVRWGIGRYLYNLASPWVPIEARGKSHFITPEGKRTLDALLRKGAAPIPTPPPQQTMAGRKNEANGLIAAREFVNAEALPALAAMKKKADLDKWLGTHAKTLDGIKAAFPEQYDALEARISRTLERVDGQAA